VLLILSSKDLVLGTCLFIKKKSIIKLSLVIWY